MSIFPDGKKQQTIIFAVVAGFWLGGWGQCICYYVKLNYIYVNSCQSVYFRLDVYHWSVSGYRNFTAGFLFLYSVFRKLKVTSAYEYLEARFDVRCRLFASMSFMLFHIGRIAIITFLTVLALRPFIAIDPVILVLLISVMCIIYTWMGGIEGVIWTDVIQGLLLSGSAILIFIVICLKVQGRH